MKKYKDLYEEEKQRHEKALQRYREDHMDEIEIISLHKRCNKKARKVPQPKKASESPKSNPPKKAGLIDDPTEEVQKSRKASRSSDVKENTIRAEKKVKKTSQPKKAPKSHEFIDLSEEGEDGPPKNDKGKKMLPLLGVKEEIPSLFDLQKDSKDLAIEKKLEKVVFMAGPYEGYKLSYVALCDTKYLKNVLKISGLEKETKDLINQALEKT